MKSFRPKDSDDRTDDQGRNPTVDFRGQKRTNDTHASATDPDARLYKKAEGQQAKLCYMGHVLMENRNGLVIDARVTQSNRTAEREAAVDMIERIPGRHQITVGADKGYDIQLILLTSAVNAKQPPMLLRRKRDQALTGEPRVTKDTASV